MVALMCTRMDLSIRMVPHLNVEGILKSLEFICGHL